MSSIRIYRARFTVNYWKCHRKKWIEASLNNDLKGDAS